DGRSRQAMRDLNPLPGGASAAGAGVGCGLLRRPPGRPQAATLPAEGIRCFSCDHQICKGSGKTGLRKLRQEFDPFRKPGILCPAPDLGAKIALASAITIVSELHVRKWTNP